MMKDSEVTEWAPPLTPSGVRVTYSPAVGEIDKPEQAPDWRHALDRALILANEREGQAVMSTVRYPGGEISIFSEPITGLKL